MSETKIDRNKLLQDSKSFCMAPWAHLHVTALGNVTACCEVQKPFANINETSIDEVWNGAEIEAFRATLMKDKKDPRCWKCYDKEKSGSVSLRQKYNDSYSHHIDWVEETTPGGRIKSAKPVYWDIRFSNICNFRCRTCWHGASSRWYGDAVKLSSQIADTAIVLGVKDPDDLLEQLAELLPHVEEIYFAGGEPLVMEAHYRILQELDASQLYNVKLRYNTNLSEMAYKDMEVMDIWAKFDDVHVFASVDATGRRGELIRKEQSWDQFVRNCEMIKIKCPNVKFFTNTTVSILNIFHIPELHRWMVERNLVNLKNCSFSLLQEPQYFNIRILPKSMKTKATRALKRHKDWIRAYGSAINLEPDDIDEQLEKIKSITGYMSAEDWSDQTLKFENITRKLDEFRDESTAKVVPELASLLYRTRLRRKWQKMRKRLANIFRNPGTRTA